MIDYSSIINCFYEKGGKLECILLEHSRGVAELALECFDRHKELFVGDGVSEGVSEDGVRRQIETAAMLHDIGICRCDAAGIECYGTEPYICHGRLGAEMLRKYAKDNGIGEDEIEPYARVCERHTGAGLTAREIEAQGLPLPKVDMLPETMVEKLVCYADKFYSKTRPEVRKSREKAVRSIAKFGDEGLERFLEWDRMFGE